MNQPSGESPKSGDGTRQAAGNRQPELSAIVLGYRAGEGLTTVVGDLTRSLEALGEAFEIVLVANYDTESDTTPAVARDLAERDPRITVVARAKDGGMGWDLRSGLAEARGRVLVVMDGDGQNPVEDVARAYSLLVTDDYDLVKGRRIARHDGLYRRLLSLTYNLIFVALFGTRGIWDVNGKPKALTLEACRRLTLYSDDWFLDAELVLSARRAGMSIGEIPVEFRASTLRPSFVRPGAILEFARHMLTYRFRGRP
jgi:glycosyltransferase involved in cell wall biosynthesis